jgi:hypothetical protein
LVTFAKVQISTTGLSLQRSSGHPGDCSGRPIGVNLWTCCLCAKLCSPCDCAV